MKFLQQHAERRPGPTSVAVGVVVALLVVLLLTTLSLGPRALVALVFGAVFALTSYARWQSDGPDARADLRRAGLAAGCVVVASVAALVLLLVLDRA